ncbi:hypothetical protein ABPG72_003707 [Tetrahymena utriculariae]
MEVQPVQIETILLTGGLGFIGSHTCVELYKYITEKNQTQNFHYKIAILDNLSNCMPSVENKIRSILKESYPEVDEKEFFSFHNIDVLDLDALNKMFQSFADKRENVNFIIHFAGKKAVGESVKNPILYFENNVCGTLNLMKMVEKFQIKNFIFSSTATVYGETDNCDEENLLNPLQSYAQTKTCCEFLMKAMCAAHPQLRMVCLRYFNPAGAHSSGLIGDSPSVYPNNLFPFLEQVVIGKREKLYIFGNDYNTYDGTGVRDFIHVVDLACAHISAIDYLFKLTDTKNFEAINIGTGSGISVLDTVTTYSKVIGRQIPYEFTKRRDGDVGQLVAKAEKAQKILNWKAVKTLEDICRDSYNFIQKNPNGIQ